MPNRKQLVRLERGIRLERIRKLSADQKIVDEYYDLTIPRPPSMRRIKTEKEAQDAFDLEVIASLIGTAQPQQPS